MCFQSPEGNVWTLQGSLQVTTWPCRVELGSRAALPLFFCSPNRKADSKLYPKPLTPVKPALRRLRQEDHCDPG